MEETKYLLDQSNPNISCREIHTYHIGCAPIYQSQDGPTTGQSFLMIRATALPRYILVKLTRKRKKSLSIHALRKRKKPIKYHSRQDIFHLLGLSKTMMGFGYAISPYREETIRKERMRSRYVFPKPKYWV